MRWWAAAILALAATGCASLSPLSSDEAAVSQIVAGAVQAMRAPAAERRQALLRAELAFKEKPDAAARLRLATLLATLPPPLRDDARAAAMLAPMRASPTPPPMARFAALMSAQVAERRQLAQSGARREDALRRQVEALGAIEREIQAREESLSKEPR